MPDNALETEYNSNCLLLPPLLFFGSFETIFSSPPLSTSSIVPLIPLSPFFRAYLAHSTHCTYSRRGRESEPPPNLLLSPCVRRVGVVWLGAFRVLFSPRPHSSSAIPFSGRDPKGGKWWISGGGRGGREKREAQIICSARSIAVSDAVPSPSFINKSPAKGGKIISFPSPLFLFLC